MNAALCFVLACASLALASENALSKTSDGNAPSGKASSGNASPGNASPGNAPSGNRVSENALSKIAAHMEKHAVVSADFVQTRKMADLKRPLVTRGRLLFARQHGVLWKIEQPYRIHYFLGEDKVIEITGEGVRKERPADTLPGMAQVGRIFRAMLGAQAQALGEHFHVEAQGDERQWEIRLKPRQPQVAQFLSSMQISGAQHVNFIQITETGGDSTEIRFQESKGAKALSDSERAEFNILGIAKKKEP